jgi:nitrate reductase NapE component
VGRDPQDVFARQEIARGLSASMVVQELVRSGYDDPESARERVGHLGPEVYRTLNRRYGLVLAVGLFFLIAAPFSLTHPQFPLKSAAFTVFAGLMGTILSIIGWVVASKFRAWPYDLEDLDPRRSRLEGLARDQLQAGKGVWWLIHEAGRLGLGDATDVRAAITRVLPGIEREYRSRLRSRLTIGLLLLAAGLSPILAVAYSAHAFSHVLETAWLMVLPLVIGIALTAHGYRGLRRRPFAGSPETGPIRTGLWWRAEPFDWK